jgi:microcystin degradation protein MlrC
MVEEKRLNPTGSPRVAILGIHLESNSFAPVTRAEDFRRAHYFEGRAILTEARKPHPAMPAEVPGFLAEMDRTGDWTAVPILVTGAEPGGPAEHEFFLETLTLMRRGLEAAMPLDAVYVTNHGAMTTTGSTDPDGLMLRAIRRVVGEKVPIVATLDLHANISELMVESADILVVYRTNPHVDQADRAREAARLLREMLAGMQPTTAFLRLPLVAPTSGMLTARGPYGELMRAGAAMIGGEVASVSVVGGFPPGDTPKNGLAILVTTRGNARRARELARALAEQGWANRQRFVPPLVPLPDAVARIAAAGHDGSPACIYADMGDNPGGGGLGSTTAFLRALLEAKATGVLYGIFHDPALAAEAHAKGEGAEFRAIFNREPSHEHSPRLETSARVRKLHTGDCIGRRGLWVGMSLDLGPTAALDLGGIVAVVVSRRKQCAEPRFFEMLGLDIAAARSVIVKSRGHFRAGFDEFFPPERVLEIDTPGLTTPVLSRFPFKHLPRPVFPLDPDTAWQPPA